MRTWGILLLLLGLALPAMAAKPMSIDEVEQLLAKFQGKPDAKAARELEDVQLTERLSQSRLARWEAEFPGALAREELIKLADVSAFLDLPASDVLRDPPPDSETGRHMLWIAEQYVATVTSRMPNFSATCETTRFAESTSSPSRADFFLGKTTSLQSAGTSSRTVTYQDGRALPAGTAEKQESDPASGLTIHCEFGPILSQVLGDAVESHVVFEHWEQGPTDPAAVFRYEVPKDSSHFAIDTTIANDARAVHLAYHGEIEIDPETGAILRLSEIAEMPPPHEDRSTAIEIEYAPVKIGDRDFIFPVKAVTFSRLPTPPGSCSSAAPCGESASDSGAWPVQTRLIHVTYTHYHESPSEHTIVVDGAASR